MYCMFPHNFMEKVLDNLSMGSCPKCGRFLETNKNQLLLSLEKKEWQKEEKSKKKENEKKEKGKKRNGKKKKLERKKRERKQTDKKDKQKKTGK